MELKVIKVKPWGEEQGDFVLINETDFDPDKHEHYEEEKQKSLTVAEIKLLLAEKGIVIPDGVTKKDDLQALLDVSNQ